MKTPFVIVMAKERAESFCRSVEMFHSHFGDQPPDEAWEELWHILDGYAAPQATTWGSAPAPFQQVFDRALLWANTYPPPPPDPFHRAHLRSQRADPPPVDSLRILEAGRLATSALPPDNQSPASRPWAEWPR